MKVWSKKLLLSAIAFFAITVQLSLAADFSYSENFSGSVGSQPIGWLNYSATIGDIDIQQDLDDPNNYVYAGQMSGSFTGSYYETAQGADWVNYHIEVDFQQSWTYPTASGTPSYLYSAVTFRHNGSYNAYMLRVRKLTGVTNTTMILGYYDNSDTQVLPDNDDVETIAQANMTGTLGSYTWYRYIIDVEGNTITAKIVDRDYPSVVYAQLTAVDTRLLKGSVGVYSAMNTSNYSEFDNVIVSGNTDLTCDMVVATYGVQGDINKDCFVDVQDLAILAGQWLKCIDAGDPSCYTPWKPMP